MSATQYVQDTWLELPVIENGVTGLGDLWECRESKPLHFNLFQKLKTEHIDEFIKATPFSSKKFNSHHIKNSSDELKTIDVSSAVSLKPEVHPISNVKSQVKNYLKKYHLNLI